MLRLADLPTLHSLGSHPQYMAHSLQYDLAISSRYIPSQGSGLDQYTPISSPLLYERLRDTTPLDDRSRRTTLLFEQLRDKLANLKLRTPKPASVASSGPLSKPLALDIVEMAFTPSMTDTELDFPLKLEPLDLDQVQYRYSSSQPTTPVEVSSAVSRAATDSIDSPLCSTPGTDYATWFPGWPTKVKHLSYPASLHGKSYLWEDAHPETSMPRPTTSGRVQFRSKNDPPPSRFQASFPLCELTNFGVVIPGGVYRSALPTEEHVDHLEQLNLKTIVSLVETPLDDGVVDWMRGRQIRHITNYVDTNKNGANVQLERTIVSTIVDMIQDVSNHPILVHCNRGKHRTGCVIGAFRISQGDPRQALTDYAHYAGNKQRDGDIAFLESYNVATTGKAFSRASSPSLGATCGVSTPDRGLEDLTTNNVIMDSNQGTTDVLSNGFANYHDGADDTNLDYEFEPMSDIGIEQDEEEQRDQYSGVIKPGSTCQQT